MSTQTHEEMLSRRDCCSDWNVMDEDCEAVNYALNLIESQPRWMDRPSGPGLWAMECVTNKHTLRWAAMLLDQSDIDRGAPFGVVRVFGPIPLPQETP